MAICNVQAISLHDRVLRATMVHYNGYEVCTEGDAFLVAFHTPEDACAWCVAVQQVSFPVTSQENMRNQGGQLMKAGHSTRGALQANLDSASPRQLAPLSVVPISAGQISKDLASASYNWP